jgi:FHA domain-containing protein
MAELMCPGCQATITAGVPYCATCMLAPVPRPSDVDDEETAEPAEPTERVAVTAPRTGERCGDPDCVHGGIKPIERCRHCGGSTPPPQRAPAGQPGGDALALVFPWGVETLPADRALAIGRENSPLAGRLAAYPNISRRHAEVSVDGGSITVTDLGSANGTFVNDTRLAPRTSTRAGPGDRIRLAADLVCRVEGRSSR